MSEFKGKVVAVTGGSRGIGRAIAEAFAAKGASVLIFSRNEREVASSAQEISTKFGNCEGIPLDVSNPVAVERVFAEAMGKQGRLDVLVTCAGIYGPIGPLEGNDMKKWADALQVNLCGTAFCARAAIKHMKTGKGGSIIAMAGGGAGGPKIKPNFSSYVTSKFGVCGFVEAISKELDGTGIRINAISPGAVNTKLLDDVLAAGEMAGREFLEASKKQKETGGTPVKAACDLALFLASKEAAHINGKTISALWDSEEDLASGKKTSGSLLNLRRVDGELYFEKKG